MTSFANVKRLRVVVTLGTSKFDEQGSDTIDLVGFRTLVHIEKAGGVQMSTLRAKIYGMCPQDMASITTLTWRPRLLIPNTVQVYAIDGLVETLVFAGNIVNAWGDYQSAPDVFLHIQAIAAHFDQLRPVTPRSFKGRVDVASVMAQIARDLGYAFENNGVSVQLSDQYLCNTGIEQAKELADAAGIGIYVDDKTIAITPRDTPRDTKLIPRIAADSGLVGYPTYDGVGVIFQSIFNPAIEFGGKVTLETDAPHAAGEWHVVSLAHRLESEKPGGAWFSTVRGNQSGLAIR